MARLSTRNRFINNSFVTTIVGLPALVGGSGGGGGGTFAYSLDFSDDRNSGYVGVIL